MPRYETYHEEQKMLRHSRKPYDRDEEDNDVPVADDDEPDRWNLDDLRDTLEEETVELDDNPWNPNNYNNNCAYMGVAHISGHDLEGVEDEFGDIPAEDEWGVDEERFGRVLDDHGIAVRESPPPEEYLDDGGRACVAYELEEEGYWHVVEVERGNDERNMTYRDYQGQANGRDVTEDVRAAERRLYFYVPDEQEEQDDSN